MAFTEDPQSLSEKGVAARQARREARKNPPSAKQSFEDATATLALDLIDAAQGRGIWKDLSASQRLSALIKCLEFGIGRPAAQKGGAEKDDVPITPENLFA